MSAPNQRNAAIDGTTWAFAGFALLIVVVQASTPVTRQYIDSQSDKIRLPSSLSNIRGSRLVTGSS